MEYSIHENGWTVIIHTPIQSLSQADKRQVLDLIIKNTCVVFRGQDLTPEEETEFCLSFGDTEAFRREDFDRAHNNIKSILLSREFNSIMRVTNKKHPIYGEPGLFGHHGDLEWHNNQPDKPHRRPFVYLYSKQGSKGSITSFTNNIIAYNHLSAEEKELYSNIEIQYGNHKWKKDDDQVKRRKDTGNRVEEMIKKQIWHKLVVENIYGQVGLNISPSQVYDVRGIPENEKAAWLKNILEYITQPKFVYDHHWEDGDVLIAEQLFGIHKRYAFEDMENRLLHRIVFNASNMIPKLRYKGFNGDLGDP
jgi:alpha-ketoglutarate-dependent taurine dioxygenase